MVSSDCSGLRPLKVILILACLSETAYCTCLPGAVPPASRINVSIAGQSRSIGIFKFSWPSAQILSSVYKILVSEILGHNVHYSGYSTSSASALYALASCKDPTNWHLDARCGGSQQLGHDVAFELWKVSIIDRIPLLAAEVGLAAMPSMVGTTGYQGFETIFVFNETMRRAYSQSGNSLDFYRSYDPEWHDTSQFFGKWQEIEQDELLPCNATLLAKHEDIVNYLKFTGDSDGIDIALDGTYSARCWNQSWWLSPACRAYPEKCIPLVTGGNGWMIYAMMQTSAAWNLPWALATAADWDHFQTLPLDYNTLFYWWKPDKTFVNRFPKQVLCPSISEQRWSDGQRNGIMMTAELDNYVSADFNSDGGRAKDLAGAISLNPEEIDLLLLDLVSGKDVETVACDWLKASGERWKAWIPLDTSCSAGMGMADKLGSFTMNRTDATACKWCSSGRASEAMNDDIGATHVCKSCSPGFSQNLPGQRTCKPCTIGTFSTEPGSTTCTGCRQGTFQNESGQSECRKCPESLTTILKGADTSSDCVCPSGTYASRGSGGCLPCPEGLTCSTGSSEEAGPCFNATGKAWPKPSAGFWLSCEEPLVAYKCITGCPGGSTDSCSDHMHRFVCGACEPGYYRNRNACQKCPGKELGWLLLASMLTVVLPIITALLHFVTRHQGKDDSITSRALICTGTVYLWFHQMFALQLESDGNSSLIGFVADVIGFTLDPRVIHSPLCLLDFAVVVVSQLALPIVVLLPFAATYTFCNILAWKCCPGLHMDWRVGISNYGSLFFIFFLAISEKALSLFVCYRHPNGQWSLKDSPDILCYSPAWMALAAPAIAAVLVFCCGFFVLVCIILQLAPARTQDVKFKTYSQFLFTRFRPQRARWSLVLLIRGTLVTLVPVIFSSASVQLVFLSSILLVYALLCLTRRPWQSLTVTLLDVTGCSFLVLTAAIFASLQGGQTDGFVAWIVGLLAAFSTLTVVSVATLFCLREWPGSDERASVGKMVTKISKMDERQIDLILQHMDYPDFVVVSEALDGLLLRKRAMRMPKETQIGQVLAMASSSMNPSVFGQGLSRISPSGELSPAGELSLSSIASPEGELPSVSCNGSSADNKRQDNEMAAVVPNPPADPHLQQ
eukprot:TRINITY_DN28232_c0_g1_i1.p1 TRINITY_DN28232_c0_g1~~TRINITY_DN28232_c0_g1_i1.p1  ORF type:complete len:1136 (+),score=142.84 TRINITY_DN28232_c0_g1_i1:23-3409(+)